MAPHELTTYHGPDRRREDVRLSILEERMGNLIQQNSEMHQRLDEDMTQLRNQTHDWMQAMLNRLPVWAVSVLTAGGTALGAMAMWILTHK